MVALAASARFAGRIGIYFPSIIREKGKVVWLRLQKRLYHLL
jgi:hypothetical protein